MDALDPLHLQLDDGSVVDVQQLLQLMASAMCADLKACKAPTNIGSEHVFIINEDDACFVTVGLPGDLAAQISSNGLDHAETCEDDLNVVIAQCVMPHGPGFYEGTLNAPKPGSQAWSAGISTLQHYRGVSPDGQPKVSALPMAFGPK